MTRLPIYYDPTATKQSDQIWQESSEWKIIIDEKLKEAQQYEEQKLWEKECIYHMPRLLRYVSKAYVPQIVSIGPYHLGTKHDEDMELHKCVAMNRIQKRTGQNINHLLKSIKEIEHQVRDCYQHKFKDLSSNQFVVMLVLDACFILELLKCYPWEKGNGDPVFSDPRIINNLLLDMVMLENQIPLFVLEKLAQLIYTSDHDPVGRLKSQILNLFNSEWLTGIPITEAEFKELKSSLHQENCLHILDIFRQSLLYAGCQQDDIYKAKSRKRVCHKLVPRCLNQWLQAGTSPDKKSTHRQVIYRVTELREGGVKFRKRNSNCIWDIRFDNGVLEIPPIWIQDSTMTILLNVAAFEQCHVKISDAVIASYVVFMQCLIKSAEDVVHLHHCGIIQHVLGDDAEVVDMFRSISKGILVDVHGGYYAELSQQVNAYCSQRGSRCRARLLR